MKQLVQRYLYVQLKLIQKLDNCFLINFVCIQWNRGANIFDSVFCCATGVTMALHAPPIPHR